jgi:two-component system LytT family response regulator
VRATLQQIEQALASRTMLKVSRSCLVNMQHVHEVNRTPRGDFILVLANGTTVTSSEGYRERVRTYLDRLRV